MSSNLIKTWIPGTVRFCWPRTHNKRSELELSKVRGDDEASSLISSSQSQQMWIHLVSSPKRCPYVGGSMHQYALNYSHFQPLLQVHALSHTFCRIFMSFIWFPTHYYISCLSSCSNPSFLPSLIRISGSILILLRKFLNLNLINRKY